MKWLLVFIFISTATSLIQREEIARVIIEQGPDGVTAKMQIKTNIEISRDEVLSLLQQFINKERSIKRL